MRTLCIVSLLLVSLVLSGAYSQRADQLADSIRQVARAHVPGPPTDGADAMALLKDSLVSEMEELPPDTPFVMRLMDLGLIAMMEGDLQLTMDLGIMAEHMSSAIGFPRGLAGGLGLQGAVHRKRNEFSQALTLSLKTLKVHEQAGLWAEAAVSLANIGNIYMEQHDPEHALAYFLRSERILDTIEMPAYSRIPTHSYLQLGTAYHQVGKCDSALHYLMAHEQVEGISNVRHPRCASSLRMAEVLADYSNAVLAESYFRTAIEQCGENMAPVANLAHLGLARLHQSQGKHSSAIPEAEQALAFFASQRAPDHVIEASKVLAAAHRAMGHYQLADSYEHRAFLLHDSLFQEKRLREFADLRTQYEVRQREAEVQAIADKDRAVADARSARQSWIIAGSVAALALVLAVALLLLRAFRKSKRDQAIIEAQSVRLQATLAEREALLREIHHRVKNNLQVISGLLSLQSGQSESEELKGLMREGQSRVKSMALIHQMLYQHDNLSAIRFQDYLEALTQELKSTYGRQAAHVQLDIQAKDATLDVDTAIPLGLIVNELVTNAYKYAFQGIGDRISIHLSQVDKGKYELLVSDNGKGLPSGFALGQSQSLGLRLVQLLCRQLRAQLSVESAQGAQFRMVFNAETQPSLS